MDGSGGYPSIFILGEYGAFPEIDGPKCHERAPPVFGNRSSGRGFEERVDQFLRILSNIMKYISD